MARAEAVADDRLSLYERDFCLWLEQQAALLREGRFGELDLAHLVEEIEAMARKDKKAIKSNLVVLLSPSAQIPVSARAAFQKLARFDRGASATYAR